MEDRKITDKLLQEFETHLKMEEKSVLTVEKYARDIRKFLQFQENQIITREMVLAYKDKLVSAYRASSVNSMLVALNQFFQYFGWYELKVKLLKIQKRVFCDENRELEKREYFQLLEKAKEQKNSRIFYVLETIGATGIRVGELPFITVEAVKNKRAEVRCKGKNRVVLLPQKLCSHLSEYIKKNGIRSGAVFVTKTGKPLHRTTVWKEMKQLCKEGEIDRGKVFPHNLRHLFARVYYKMEKDISKLADLLGHSSIETTRIYIISSGREHMKQIEMLGLVDELQIKTAKGKSSAT